MAQPDNMNPFQAQLNQIQKDLNDLSQEFYRNNFSAKQDFTKTSNFTTLLKVPHYVTAPTITEAGYLIEVNGKLMVSTGSTFVIVGTQS